MFTYVWGFDWKIENEWTWFQKSNHIDLWRKKKEKKKNKERKCSNENLKKSAEVGNDGNLSHLAIEGIFYVP